MAAVEAAAAYDDRDLGPLENWAGENGIESSKLNSEYVHRLTAGRDMHVIVTASGETGVGKTTLAFALAMLWDQSGWTVDKACVADASKYSRLYEDEENILPGSVLILDEAEKAADARRSMKKSSVQLSQDFAAKRYRQIFGILTAPSKGWVDKRLGSSSADYWIQAQETDTGKPKGEATVYRLKENEHYEREYTTREETISWPVLDHHPEFRRLDRIKTQQLSTEHEEQTTYTEDEVEKKLKERYKEGIRQGEANILTDIYSNTSMSHKQLANKTTLSKGTINNRINGK